MNWAWYLALAEGLAAHRLEASDRSAASRAYYAAFNEARRWLEANGTAIDDLRAHSQVWRAFETAGSAAPATRGSWFLVGSLGNSLRVLRNQADYDDVVLDLEGRVDAALRDARRIFALLSDLTVAG